MTTKVDWIKCSERMPEEGKLVLVWDRLDLRVGFVSFDVSADGSKLVLWELVCDRCWGFPDDSNGPEITHWMPLPEGPNE